MLCSHPALDKLYSTPHEIIEVGDDFCHVIPDEIFTPEEIEFLRQHYEDKLEDDNERIYANFLPDDIRPPGVKKL